MKRLNEKGFSAIEAILLLVIISLVGFVGYFVYNSQQKTNSTLDDTAKSQGEIQKSENSLPTYVLPEAWSKLQCDSIDSTGVVASPDNDKAVDCDDRTNTVFIYVTSGSNDKCLTINEVEDIKKNKMVNSYDCEEITVNNVKVIKTIADYGGGLLVSYEFAENPQLIVTYYASSDGTLTNSNLVEQLVQSVSY